MQAILGIWGAGRGRLHMADDRVGTGFQGDTAVTGAMTGVREGIYKGFTGGAPPKPTRRGKRGIGSGGRQGRRRQQAQDFQDSVSRDSRTDALPSQRVYWQGSDVDSNVGALLVPARPGHRGDTGGGKPPSPTVPSV